MIIAAGTGVTGYATPTDRELAFDAFSNPKHVPNWLTGPEGRTMPACEIDLRPGGTWRDVYRKTSGAEMPLTGSFLEVAPPERLVSTESWGPDWPETKEARDAALQTGMKQGMGPSFTRLDTLLRTLV